MTSGASLLLSLDDDSANHALQQMLAAQVAILARFREREREALLSLQAWRVPGTIQARRGMDILTAVHPAHGCPAFDHEAGGNEPIVQHRDPHD